MKNTHIEEKSKNLNIPYKPILKASLFESREALFPLMKWITF